jgi:hypothetical protein
MNKPKVIYYGGLLNSVFKWLERHLILELKSDFPQYEFEGRTWLNKDPIPEGTALVIGHSFGGYRALKMTRALNIPVISIDPRWIVFKELKTFNRSTVNFYQCGFMNGFPVLGSALNYMIKDLSHIGILKAFKVHSRARMILGGKRGV